MYLLNLANQMLSLLNLTMQLSHVINSSLVIHTRDACMTKFSLTLGMIFLAVNFSCAKESKPSKHTPFNVSLPGKRGTANLRCGSKTRNVSWIVHNDNVKTNRFAIVLGGSPVTSYLSDQSTGARTLVTSLMDKDYRVFELRYPGSMGFYNACRAEGLDNIVLHTGDIYDLAQKVLGFDPHNGNHVIIGVGFSIGAIKLQAMSFILGKRMDRIALTGVLMGNVQKGCSSYLSGISDGFSWSYFHDYAAIITKDLRGCHSDSEYNATRNFENLPFAHQGLLGLFEGESLHLPTDGAPGNPDQARYIAQKRTEMNAPVVLKTYEHCGHELFNCTQGKVVKDIVHFLTD